MLLLMNRTTVELHVAETGSNDSWSLVDVYWSSWDVSAFAYIILSPYNTFRDLYSLYTNIYNLETNLALTSDMHQVIAL